MVTLLVLESVVTPTRPPEDAGAVRPLLLGTDKTRNDRRKKAPTGRPGRTYPVLGTPPQHSSTRGLHPARE